MLGRCYLVTGEGQKALDCFRHAASEVGKEEFLDRLIRSEDGEIVSTPKMQYYDKVHHCVVWSLYITLCKNVPEIVMVFGEKNNVKI